MCKTEKPRSMSLRATPKQPEAPEAPGGASRLSHVLTVGSNNLHASNAKLVPAFVPALEQPIDMMAERITRSVKMTRPAPKAPKKAIGMMQAKQPPSLSPMEVEQPPSFPPPPSLSPVAGRVAVKIMGSKTVPLKPERSDQDTAYAWAMMMSSKLPIFETYYGKLQEMFPGQQFAFYTDGDPPDKEDDWKMFAAYVSKQPGNTLTITRKDRRKMPKCVDDWTAKGVQTVYLEVASDPRKYTLSVTKAVVVMNVVPETPVFSPQEGMLDGPNFKDFQIYEGEWKVPSKNSSRTILHPTNLENTNIMTRGDMERYLMSNGVGYVVVKSQGQTELEQDFGTYPEPTQVDDNVKIYKNPLEVPRIFQTPI